MTHMTTHPSLQPQGNNVQSRFRVLLVEDDINISRLVEANLRKARLDCSIVRTGREALDAVSRDEADLILLDLGLPDINGLEVCRKIRETSNVPIIMATARNEAQDQMNGLRAGADDYVTKPFDPQVLVARVVAHLRRAHRYSNDTNDTLGGANPVRAAAVYGTRQAPINIANPGATPSKVSGVNRIASSPTVRGSIPATVPPRWHKCVSCNYMGPRGKFESIDDIYGVKHACPHCGQPVRA